MKEIRIPESVTKLGNRCFSFCENLTKIELHENIQEIPYDCFWECFNTTAEKLGIECEFNCLANAGANAPFVAQSVFHFHLHLVTGERTNAFNELISEIQK